MKLITIIFTSLFKNFLKVYTSIKNGKIHTINPIAIIVYLWHIYSILGHFYLVNKKSGISKTLQMRSQRQVVEDNFWCSLSLPRNYTDFTTIFKSLAIKQQNNSVNWKQKKLYV